MTLRLGANAPRSGQVPRLGACVALLMLLVPQHAASQVLAPAQRAQGAQRVDSLTARITGKVTTSDTGTPLRGAEVRLMIDGRGSRLATTNADGRYELRDLPAGEYRMTVSRTGFISMQYGQRRPFETARAIPLAEGESVEANIGLIRGGVIYGRVMDQYSEPLAGTRVQVLRSRTVQGRRRLQSVGVADQTDDTGSFRIYGLPPGDYYVAAAAGLGEQVKRDPPTYFPGTANFADAQPIALAAGIEAIAEFHIAPVRNARVSGIVVSSSGAPARAMINLNSETVSMGPVVGAGAGESLAAALAVHGDSQADGTFTLENVPPGPYTMTAMFFRETGIGSSGPPPPGPPSVTEMINRMPESVATPIVVTGEDISNMTLVLRKPTILSGSFVADTGVTQRLPRNMRVDQRSAGGGTGLAMSLGNAGQSEFQLVGLVGPFTIKVQGVPEGWTVKSMLIDGRDMSDEIIDLNGQDATLRIVMSDRPSSVMGTVRLRGEPIDDAVIVFPEDASKWTFPSRFVRTTRADVQGRYRIADLPAGERYLAAAIDYLEDGEQDDAQFLERLRSRAVSFTLREGEQRSVFLETISR